MLAVDTTTQFKRDLKLAKKRNKNLEVLKKIMKLAYSGHSDHSFRLKPISYSV